MAIVAETKSDTEVQMNFRASPETRKQARIAAVNANLSLAQWLKQTVELRIQQEQSQEQTP